MSQSTPVLDVRGLSKRFRQLSPLSRRTVGLIDAMAEVDLRVEAGRTTALVGESGSGKTTLARCVLGLETPDAGVVRIGDLEAHPGRPRAKERAARVQVVFQDPNTSLTPRMELRHIIGEPLVVHRAVSSRRELADRVAEAMESVGIPRDWARRRPSELSGGQRQRVAIARALVLRPSLIVLDEPVSALDVSIQAQIINLLEELQDAYGIGYLLISHDLAIVRAIAHSVYVMYRGRIVESGAPDRVLTTPRHPYTESLLHAEPSHPAWDLDVFDTTAERPGRSDWREGCAFAGRCGRALDVCRGEVPADVGAPDGGVLLCHHPLPSHP
ncbi:oligopeptide/dipeptide ABC transporter ATP-binding protein [Jiangella mangrovi]|uniref:Oligopeptide/dipeptide ABC transporter ATP-binding protein n=1 Tax=Jiangella mangrovi TaxID=1524084 RepID=A0A7W9LM26_9ACTN|nr:oligopeptide/dipeptide ABC transporter ATP-binding protein [Jiangella mangrovi]MBB5788833.1 oligopeptide/dipeptide ABC transporter ATP-binding protein [Jiangella mangrovi]